MSCLTGTVLLSVPFTELLDLTGSFKLIHKSYCVLRIQEKLYCVSPAWASSIDGDPQKSRERHRLSEAMPAGYTLAAVYI